MNKLLSFDNFKKMQAIVEAEEANGVSLLEKVELWEAEQLLNEGFSSTIFSQLIQGDVRQNSKWDKKFQVDIYKKYKIAIGDIQDTDFTILTDPTQFFKAPYKNDDDYLGFCINDNPDVIQRVSRSTSGAPLLVAIVMGGRGLFYGFAKEPGYKQGGQDKYGALANEWGQATYFGLKYNDIKPTNAKWIQEFTTKVYVVKLSDLQAKYSVSDKQKARQEARKGAVAMISYKSIKDANISRYKKIISEKVGPADILAQFQSIFDKATSGFSDWTKKIKLTDIESIRNVDEINFGGWSRRNPGNVLSQIYDTLGKYMYDYIEYARKVKRIEMMSEQLESGKDENGVELSEENKVKIAQRIEYYQEDLKQTAVKFVEYKQTFLAYDKQVTEGLAYLDTLIK